MKKADIINVMAEKSGLSKVDAEKALKAFFESIMDGLKKHQKIALVGYLSLEKTYRKATIASNPKTRTPVNVPAKVSVKIRPGKLLLDAVAGSVNKK